MLFIEEYSFQARKEESDRVRHKHPDKVPLIIERVEKNTTLPPLDKKKFLVPGDITVGQLIFVIRKRIKLRPDQAIFLFTNGVIPPSSSVLSIVYNEHKNEDGFLYCKVTSETTFGARSKDLFKVTAN